MSAYLIRDYLGSPFLSGQQCAKEFIEMLLMRFCQKKLFYRYTQCTNINCRLFQQKQPYRNAGIAPINPRDNSSFEEKLKNWWKPLERRKCTLNLCNMQLHYNVDNIIVQIARYSESGTLVEKRHVPVSNYRLINIGNSSYRIVSAIQHFGSNIRSGHYVALVNTQEYGWLRFDDLNVEFPITRTTFPEGLDNVYLLFLEKFDSWATFAHDDASCSYATSAMHALFALKNFRKLCSKLAVADQFPSLVSLFDQYMAKSQQLSTLELRKVLNVSFIAPQTKAIEFIESLLKSLGEIEFFHTGQRFRCANEKCPIYRHDMAACPDDIFCKYIIVEPRNTSSFEKQLCGWQRQGFLKKWCCSDNNVELSIDIVQSPEQILVYVERWGISKARDCFDNYPISDFNDRLSIGKNTYKVVSVIEHVDPTRPSNYYVAWIHSEDYGWLKFHDTNDASPTVYVEFPKTSVKNVVMLFLEKISV